MLFEFGKKHYNAYNEDKMRKACINKSKQVLITFMKRHLREFNGTDYRTSTAAGYCSTQSR